MGAESLWHWFIVAIVLFLLFGRGKVPELMGDAARGIKAFRKAMADDKPSGLSEPDAEHDTQSTSQ